MAWQSLKAAKPKVPKPFVRDFPVLDEMVSAPGGDLSGGQQQQLAIARALASEPTILDEPTEGIQPSIIKDIGRVIRRLADRRRYGDYFGRTVLWTLPKNLPTTIRLWHGEQSLPKAWAVICQKRHQGAEWQFSEQQLA